MGVYAASRDKLVAEQLIKFLGNSKREPAVRLFSSDVSSTSGDHH